MLVSVPPFFFDPRMQWRANKHWERWRCGMGHSPAHLQVSIDGATPKGMVSRGKASTNGWCRGTPIYGTPHFWAWIGLWAQAAGNHGFDPKLIGASHRCSIKIHEAALWMPCICLVPDAMACIPRLEMVWVWLSPRLQLECTSKIMNSHEFTWFHWSWYT